MGIIPYPTTPPTKAPAPKSPADRRRQTTGAAYRGDGGTPPSAPSPSPSDPFSRLDDISLNELAGRGAVDGRVTGEAVGDG